MPFRERSEYREWQNQVKERDGHTCRRCGFESNLHAHHIKPVKTYPELAFDIDNGLTLCGNCHSLITGREDEINIEEFVGESSSIDSDLFSFGSTGLLKLIEAETGPSGQAERKHAEHITDILNDLYEFMDFSVNLPENQKEDMKLILGSLFVDGPVDVNSDRFLVKIACVLQSMYLRGCLKSLPTQSNL